MNANLTPEVFEELARAKDLNQTLAFLDTRGLIDPHVAAELAERSLEQAETDPDRANHWIQVAETLVFLLGEDLPAVQAKIHYAQARLALLSGDLKKAEREIRQAQAYWRRIDDRASLARSALGLTQVLALQGRYSEAETTIQNALQDMPLNSTLRAQALVNLANLLRRREQHALALENYRQAEAIYRAAQASAPEPQAEILRRKAAYTAVNQANALMALDRPLEAEKILHNALAVLRECDDKLNLGRTLTNLGTLYLRTGRYTQALDAFQQATDILLPEGVWIDQDLDTVRQADILLLEQANAYLALNLIPEAIHALQGAVQLFRQAGQPYELGQSLYTLALVHLRNGWWHTAQELLEEALRLFSELENLYWQNKVKLAQATMAFRQGDFEKAQAYLEELPLSGEISAGWDLSLQVEATLLHVQVLLVTGQTEKVQQWASELLRNLEDQIAQQDLHLPHLSMALNHAHGTVALATGQPQEALSAFQAAVRQLEHVRVRLPMEEAKTAYLDDKESYYGGWIASLLSQAPRSQELTGPIVDKLFAVAERARSQVLLERLHVTMDSVDWTEASQDLQEQTDTLRRELHWLYNQLLLSPNEVAREQRLRQIEAREAALARLSWQQGAFQAQVQPAKLRDFQSALRAEEQALVYYWLDSPLKPSMPELLVFVVSRSDAFLVRTSISELELEDLAAELRFQMGRVEIGISHSRRHHARLLQGVQKVLGELYQKMLAPVTYLLSAPQLLIVPHGLLHRLPIHAFWDGQQYLLEKMVCRYAPSPGVAVHLRYFTEQLLPETGVRWAGLAPDDPSIPGARMEVERAAALFQEARLYLGERSNEAGLQEASSWAHVLHLATHGLFRPDNPFFSALKLADGWIDVRRLYRLPLRSRLVVLSACESGAGLVRGGDEVIGLVRGFLGAGARSLVVSLWNVHDRSVVDLTSEFYKALHLVRSPAQALHKAQQEAIRRGQHPYFWAPFVAIE